MNANGWEELINKVLDYIDKLDSEWKIKYGSDNSATSLLYGIVHDSWFRFWHRTQLPRDNYAMDLDLIECINDNPLALIEAKKWDKKPSEWQQKIYSKLAQTINIPLYIIEFRPPLGKAEFLITKFIGKTRQGSTDPMSEFQLKTFYQNIRKNGG